MMKLKKNIKNHLSQPIKLVTWVINRVFKPGLVVDPIQGSSHWVLTWSTLILFYINQTTSFWLKKNSQRVAIRFLTGSIRSHGFLTSLIFSQPQPGSSPGSAGSQVDLSSHVLKL